MFALMLQEATDSVAQVVELWHMLVAVISPLVIGLITNEQTRDAIKRFLPLVASGGAALITEIGSTDIGAEVIVLVPVLWAGIEFMYRFYSGVVAIVKRKDATVNEVLAPQVALIK